jgi:N4-(beta-N-acetylglucosaminyl)-L-asparaginase
MSDSLSRRSFLQVSAAASAASCAGSQASFAIRSGPRRGPVAVSSRNGIKAVEIAVAKMREGWRPVDAAVAGIEVVENDPNDDSVGLGGLPNEDGIVELDACVMDGPSGLGGAVASLRNIKNPSQVALKVMRHTDHVLLVGEGALRFARAHGFPEEDLLTENSRKQWLEWREKRSSIDDWIDPTENGEHGKEWFANYKHKTGTIHVGAVGADGAIGGCTSTSGLAFKLAGRVGDSPLLGCGNYVDNDVGVAGSTGVGEVVILTNGSAYVVHMMKSGMSPTDACLAACKRIVAMTKVKRRLDDRGRPNFQVNFYAINKAGEYGAAALYPSKHARMTENGPVLADSAHLLERK